MKAAWCSIWDSEGWECSSLYGKHHFHSLLSLGGYLIPMPPPEWSGNEASQWYGVMPVAWMCTGYRWAWWGRSWSELMQLWLCILILWVWWHSLVPTCHIMHARPSHWKGDLQLQTGFGSVIMQFAENAYLLQWTAAMECCNSRKWQQKMEDRKINVVDKWWQSYLVSGIPGRWFKFF